LIKEKEEECFSDSSSSLKKRKVTNKKVRRTKTIILGDKLFFFLSKNIPTAYYGKLLNQSPRQNNSWNNKAVKKQTAY